MENKDKRSTPRFLKKVMFSLKRQGLETEEIAATNNISLTGMQVVLSCRLQTGDIIRAQIEFSNDPLPITVDCRVVYVKEENDNFITGLSFENIEDFEKERLRRLLEMV